MGKIISITDKDSLQNAAEVLKNGGVLIFPTDTVYGIGCLMIEDAIKKLYKIKDRPASQPTAILMNRDWFDSKRTEDLVLDESLDQRFIFGELTIIDDAAKYAIDFPKMILSQDNTIGVRLPQHEWLAELIDLVGPIVASSANKKGNDAPTDFRDLSEKIIGEADLTIESDEALSGQPSSVYKIETGEYLR